MQSVNHMIVLWFYCFGILHLSLNAQAVDRACRSCTIACREVWWDESKADLCRNCMKYLCLNNTSTLGDFFRDHLCISVPQNGSSPTFKNQSLSRLILNNAIRKARTCEPNQESKAGEILVYQQTIQALLNETRQNRTLDLSRFVEETEEENRYRKPVLRSGTSPQQICSSEGNFKSPRYAKHENTGMIVEILRYGQRKQIFYVQKCRSVRPMITITRAASCKTGIALHRAYIKVKHTQYLVRPERFRNCISRGDFMICDDWIQLPSFCTLFIS